MVHCFKIFCVEEFNTTAFSGRAFSLTWRTTTLSMYKLSLCEWESDSPSLNYAQLNCLVHSVRFTLKRLFQGVLFACITYIRILCLD